MADPFQPFHDCIAFQTLIRGNTPSLLLLIRFSLPTTRSNLLRVANLGVLYPAFDIEVVIYSQGNYTGPRAAVVRVPRNPEEAHSTLGSSVLIEGVEACHPTATTLRGALGDIFQRTMELLSNKM